MSDAPLPKDSLERQSGFTPGARAEAILRGRAIAEEDLLASGGALNLEQVCQFMHGVSRQSIEKKVRDQAMFSVPGPGNRRCYPVVQFNDDGSVVVGLPEVLKALPTNSGFAILNFLVHPDDSLGGRKPIDMLKSGDIDLVLQAARSMGEHSA